MEGSTSFRTFLSPPASLCFSFMLASEKFIVSPSWRVSPFPSRALCSSIFPGSVTLSMSVSVQFFSPSTTSPKVSSAFSIVASFDCTTPQSIATSEPLNTGLILISLPSTSFDSESLIQFILLSELLLSRLVTVTSIPQQALVLLNSLARLMSPILLILPGFSSMASLLFLECLLILSVMLMPRESADTLFASSFAKTSSFFISLMTLSLTEILFRQFITSPLLFSLLLLLLSLLRLQGLASLLLILFIIDLWS
mmetsp:Transcript_8284/g.15967  ORF Transcript_8284/g.15967 Transcript_8284/m.15967 type:complete len:254 (+) Transcript_8284:573-1334(+)